MYLHGLTFKIITDCNSLVMAMRKININPRITRWSLFLQSYDFELVHQSSNRMVHVDCLSRQIMSINIVSFEDELIYKQLMDPKLKGIVSDLEFRESKYFTLQNGLLFKNYHDRQLLVIPENMVNNIIRIYHDENGHVGLEKTLHGILEHYWFPCMKLRIREYLNNCVKCLNFSIAAGKIEGEMEVVDTVAKPMSTLHVDHYGPLEEAKEKYKYILVTVDAFTKYVWLNPCHSTTSEEVIAHLTNLTGQFGLPDKIISDRGTAYTSKNFATFVKDNGIKHILTAVASPLANGQVERVNRFMRSTLAKMVDEPSKWSEILSKVQYVLNNTLHKSIKTTPFKPLLGYSQRNKNDKELSKLIDDLVTVDKNIEQEREELRDAAALANRAVQMYNKTQYDRRHKKPLKYKEGDLVLIRVTQYKPGTNQKLAPKFKGPYQISKILKKNRFVVTDVPGYNLTQKPLNTILSADKLKSWIRIADTSNDSD